MNQYVGALGTMDLASYIPEIYTDDKATKLAAVYRAVNVIADSVAILPINIYRYDGNWKKREYTDLYYLLNVQPNPTMNGFTFKKTLITHLKLKGNAYILIDRNIKNDVKALYLVHPDRVKVELNKNTLEPIYSIDGAIASKGNLVHLINYSLNGYYGVSTLEYARSVLATTHYTEEHAKHFFENGANLTGILKPKDGVFMTDEQAVQAKNKFLSEISPKSGGKNGSVVVLSSNLEFQSVSLSPKDAMLLETKEFNILSIAQFFGVPLSKLFYYKNNKYNTVESEQLDFLTSTIQPIIEMIEVELFRKLIVPSEWNLYELKFEVSNLLRLDATTQADVLTKYINTGVYSINEVREKLDADYPVSGGNRNLVGQNMQPLDNLLNDIKNKEE